MRLIRNSLISIFLCEQHHHFPNNAGLNPCRHQWLMSFIKDTRCYCGIKEKTGWFFPSNVRYYLFSVSSKSTRLPVYLPWKCFLHLSTLCFHGNHCCLLRSLKFHHLLHVCNQLTASSGTQSYYGPLGFHLLMPERWVFPSSQKWQFFTTCWPMLQKSLSQILPMFVVISSLKIILLAITVFWTKWENLQNSFKKFFRYVTHHKIHPFNM